MSILNTCCPICNSGVPPDLQSGVKNVVAYLGFADLESAGTPGGFCLVCPTRSEPTVTGRSGIENRWSKGKTKVKGGSG